MIGAAEFVFAPVTKTSDLYTQLGYDSLSFVSLLLEIEGEFAIKFELPETGMCTKADALIAIVEKKVRENKGV